MKAQIIALERPKDAPLPLSLGVGVIDLALGGGLALGAIHELSGAAASLFAVMLAARTGGDVLWCTPSHIGDYSYPPGLMGLGLNPDRLLHFTAKNDKDILWATHEALRSGAVKTVIAELRHGIDLASARKLQLAAEAGGGLGLFFNIAMHNAPHIPPPLIPAAVTRWQVGGIMPGMIGVPEIIMPRNGETALHLALTRNRRGVLGQWDLLWRAGGKRGQTMEQDHATHYFSLVSQTGGQPFHPHHVAMAQSALYAGSGAG